MRIFLNENFPGLHILTSGFSEIFKEKYVSSRFPTVASSSAQP